MIFTRPSLYTIKKDPAALPREFSRVYVRPPTITTGESQPSILGPKCGASIPKTVLNQTSFCGSSLVKPSVPPVTHSATGPFAASGTCAIQIYPVIRWVADPLNTRRDYFRVRQSRGATKSSALSVSDLSV